MSHETLKEKSTRLIQNLFAQKQKLEAELDSVNTLIKLLQLADNKGLIEDI